jgi:hypothetical protein
MLPRIAYVEVHTYEGASLIKDWFESKYVKRPGHYHRSLTVAFLPSDFQNRRATATLTMSAQGNPFRTLPKGMPERSPHSLLYHLISALEPPPRAGAGQQQVQAPVPVVNPTGGAMGRGGGGGNFRGNQMNQMNMMGNMRGGNMMGGNMMRQGMMGGIGAGMGPGLGLGMGGFVGGGNPGFQSGGGFGGGRGGGMIPQGPRGGMIGGRGGGMMGGMGTNF